MPKLLLRLFTPIVIVATLISCGNKKETEENYNEKWVIDKVNATGDKGTLVIDLPKETEWDITIYPADSTKVLSNTLLQKTFSLVPGNYDLEINHILIRKVPIEKGNNTRLKAGTLKIKNKTAWTLYDETKQKVLINSSAAVTKGLPIGKYKLTIDGEDHDIEIKDGKTVKY